MWPRKPMGEYNSCYDYATAGYLMATINQEFGQDNVNRLKLTVQFDCSKIDSIVLLTYFSYKL